MCSDHKELLRAVTGFKAKLDAVGTYSPFNIIISRSEARLENILSVFLLLVCLCLKDTKLLLIFILIREYK